MATQDWQAQQQAQAELKWVLTSQVPRVCSSDATNRGSPSDGDFPVLPTKHPSSPTLFTQPCFHAFARAKRHSRGTKVKAKNLTAIYSATSSQISQFRGGKLLMPLLTLHYTQAKDLLEISTERGSPMNRKSVKANPQREKNTTCPSPPVFSAFDFALTNRISFVYKVLTPIQLTKKPILTKFVTLPQFDQKSLASRCLYRCQNTAPSSLEKYTLVVSPGELKSRQLNSKTCAHSAQVSTYSQEKSSRGTGHAVQHPTHTRAGPCHEYFSPRPPRGQESPASMFLVSSLSDTEVRSGRRARRHAQLAQGTKGCAAQGPTRPWRAKLSAERWSSRSNTQVV